MTTISNKCSIVKIINNSTMMLFEIEIYRKKPYNFIPDIVEIGKRIIVINWLNWKIKVGYQLLKEKG